MSTKARFPWVNVWMIAFSAAGIWITVSGFLDAGSENRAPSFQDIAGWALLGVILLVAFWRLPKSLFSGEYDGEQMVMNDLGGLYLTAWRKLWRQRWILRLFGLVCLINILGGVIYSLAWHYFPEQLAATNGLSIGAYSGDSPFQYFAAMLRQALANSVYASIWHFFPSVGLDQSLVVAMLSFVATLFFIPAAWKWLRAMAGGSLDAREITVMRGLLTYLTVLSVAAIPALMMLLTQYHAGAANHWGRRVTPGLQSILSWPWSLAASVVIAPILIGGLAGSLRRITAQETVTAHTFLIDVVRFFTPLTRIFLVFWLFEAALGAPWFFVIGRDGVPGWPQTYSQFATLISTLIALLLMFAPYAVIVRGTGAWGSIRVGFRDWISHAGDVVSFVALGITFITVFLVLRDMVTVWVAPQSPLTMLTGAAGTLIYVLLAALMAVAVWEFYWRITQTEKAEAPAS